jgi:hypothetical protein
MKKQMQQMQQKIESQERLLEKLTAERKVPAPSQPIAAAPAPAASPAPAAASETQEQMERRVTDSVMRKLQPSLAAANKTFPSQFNPAISLATDFVGSYQDKQRGNFEFPLGRDRALGERRSVRARLCLLQRDLGRRRGRGSGDRHHHAALEPDLQGGRFFADFGRLSKWHDHDLPFVNRPTVLDEYVNGESQADGLQMSWLAPTSST